MGTKGTTGVGMKIMFLRTLFIFCVHVYGRKETGSKIRDEKDPLPSMGPKRIR